MSKITSVICELNPLHYGHLKVFSEIADNEKDAVIIAVMSGNITQRSLPAIYDKYIRAETAVKNGANIVVELPFPWSSSGAESFALGGIRIASELGTQKVYFGSESADLGYLLKASEIKDSDEFKSTQISIEKSERGQGSASVFEKAMSRFGIDSLKANDKLAIEYIRYGKKEGINEFFPVKRDEKVTCSSELRDSIYNYGIENVIQYLPESEFTLLSQNEPSDMDSFYKLLFAYSKLQMKGKTDILKYIIKRSRESENEREFIKLLPNSKHTRARLIREILYDMFDIGKDFFNSRPEYTVLLAADEKGKNYLSENRKRLSSFLITKPSDTENFSDTAQKQIELLRKSDELYTLLTNKKSDYFLKKHPYIKKRGEL